MAGKFSRKKQETGASWVLGAVLIALLLAAITLGALCVLRASKAVDASDNAVSQTPAEPSGAQENTMQQPQMTESAAEPQPEEDTGLVDRIKAAVRADPVGYVRHLFSVLRASVGPLLRGFRVSKLNVIWTITGETAAETAILYGQTLTTLNTILAIAQDHIKIQADQLWLEADYTGSAKQQRVVSLKLLLCPLLALVTVVCFVWHARHDPQLLPPKHPKYNTPETEQGGNL